MIRTEYAQMPAEFRAESGDVVQIETQHDKTRGTVLYVHVNGTTVLRIQNLSKGSQIANITRSRGIEPYTIDMIGRSGEED